jgi:hypothetical protein
MVRASTMLAALNGKDGVVQLSVLLVPRERVASTVLTVAVLLMESFLLDDAADDVSVIGIVA